MNVLYITIAYTYFSEQCSVDTLCHNLSKQVQFASGIKIGNYTNKNLVSIIFVRIFCNGYLDTTECIRVSTIYLCSVEMVIRLCRSLFIKRSNGLVE